MSILSASSQDFQAVATSPQLGSVKTADSSRHQSGLLTRLLRRAILSRMENLHGGFLEVVDAGVVARFGTSEANAPRIEVRVHDPRFYRNAALGGSLGVADAYRRSTDFIQKHVFPGGCLPSLGAICRAIGAQTDLRITHVQDFAPHYARTLAEWRRRFFDRIDRIRSLGADEHFIRCWDYYLAYCEAGFAERQIGVSRILASKPDCRDEPANSCLI